MFKVENLNQINDFSYKPIGRENKYKYIIINKQYTNKKYEIGKRYKQDIVFYDNLSNLPSYPISKAKNFKIMEIKIFGKVWDDIANDFKIIREIDYSNLLNSDDIVENMISAIKNHEEIVLNAFLNSKENIYLKVVVNSGIYKYLDEIITEYKINGKTEYEHIVSLIIKKYGRNKDLDHFIHYDNSLMQKEILNIGRPQDLNLMQNKNKMSNNELRLILNHGRKKDIEHYSKICNIFFKDTINKAIINTYNDDFIDDCIKIYYNDLLLMDFIVKYANKKQLDILVKNNSQSVRLSVAKREYKEHLDKLANDDNIHIYEFVSEKLKDLNSI
jgi:hypothetical protein